MRCLSWEVLKSCRSLRRWLCWSAAWSPPRHSSGGAQAAYRVRRPSRRQSTSTCSVPFALSFRVLPPPQRKCPGSAFTFLRKSRRRTFQDTEASKELSRGKEGTTMNTRKRVKSLLLLTFAALAIVLAVNASSEARGTGGQGFGGGHVGGSGVHQGVGHPGFDNHHGFNGHHGFDGHHGFEHRRFGFGPVWPYYGYYPPIYGYPGPTYWYYCPSYGAYYPNVGSCPEAWVPVPAS